MMAVVHASDPQLQPAPPPPPPEPATEEAVGLIGLNALLPGPLDHPANELGMFHMTQNRRHSLSAAGHDSYTGATKKWSCVP